MLFLLIVLNFLLELFKYAVVSAVVIITAAAIRRVAFTEKGVTL